MVVFVIKSFDSTDIIINISLDHGVKTIDIQDRGKQFLKQNITELCE